MSVEFPNAISPKECGISEDERQLALAFSGLTVEAYTHISDLQDLFVAKDQAEISVDDKAWEMFAVHGMGSLESTVDQVGLVNKNIIALITSILYTILKPDTADLTDNIWKNV